MYSFPHRECQEKNGKIRRRFCSMESRSSSEWSRARHPGEGKKSEEMEMVHEREHHSGENVVPCVRDHAGAKTPAQNGETAEERAICGDGDYTDCAFIPVTDAEEER